MQHACCSCKHGSLHLQVLHHHQMVLSAPCHEAAPKWSQTSAQPWLVQQALQPCKPAALPSAHVHVTWLQASWASWQWSPAPAARWTSPVLARLLAASLQPSRAPRRPAQAVERAGGVQPVSLQSCRAQLEWVWSVHDASPGWCMCMAMPLSAHHPSAWRIQVSTGVQPARQW